jgi:transcriptional regulator with XRE-family HTH domain
MSLADLIKKARKSSGMTLDELAECASMSKSYIWSLENGVDTNPTLGHCVRLSLALGISVNAMAAASVA